MIFDCGKLSIMVLSFRPPKFIENHEKTRQTYFFWILAIGNYINPKCVPGQPFPLKLHARINSHKCTNFFLRNQADVQLFEILSIWRLGISGFPGFSRKWLSSRGRSSVATGRILMSRHSRSIYWLQLFDFCGFSPDSDSAGHHKLRYKKRILRKSVCTTPTLDFLLRDPNGAVIRETMENTVEN